MDVRGGWARKAPQCVLARTNRRGKGRRRKRQSSPVFWILFVVGCAFILNIVVQIARKPTEVIGLFEDNFHKTPEETWSEYGSAFVSRSTSVMTPDFLAALAQNESNGNPVVRTYWKWRWTTDPQKIFAPASSAVGLFQITEGTFEESRRFCVRDGRPYRDDGGGECFGNFVYSRMIPSHAIEMTAARLHYHVDKIMAQSRRKNVSLSDRQALATIIHLCGVGKGEQFARLGFNARRLGRCGDHDPAAYVARIRRLQERFRHISLAQGH